MTNDDEKWISDTFGQLFWSMAIDDNPYQVIPSATDDFLTLMKTVLLEFEILDPSKHTETILRDYASSIVRKLAFRFQKDLRKRLRSLYPKRLSQRWDEVKLVKKGDQPATPC